LNWVASDLTPAIRVCFCISRLKVFNHIASHSSAASVVVLCRLYIAEPQGSNGRGVVFCDWDKKMQSAVFCRKGEDKNLKLRPCLVLLYRRRSISHGDLEFRNLFVVIPVRFLAFHSVASTVNTESFSATASKLLQQFVHIPLVTTAVRQLDCIQRII